MKQNSNNKCNKNCPYLAYDFKQPYCTKKFWIWVDEGGDLPYVKLNDDCSIFEQKIRGGGYIGNAEK